ncbi:MAG: hypothetical protein LC785_16925 [Acidobacteria bacterium]|nr:hypothetical protein [Acidobacteriota bacterium]MCA1643584.1 hypothetical protein [Acidobacteriota bacterium]
MKVLSHQFASRLARLVACGALALSALCAAAQAQSGRRVNAGVKPGTPPPPAPVIELTKPEPAPPKRVLPKVALVVAVRVEKSSGRAEAIVNTFITHLAKSMPTTSLGLVKHDVAEKRARAETENYVIWLELDRDAVQNGQIIFNSPDYVVRYSMLAPQTAKVLARGKVYYQSMGGARGRSGDGEVIKISPEAAGEAAADMALDWLAFVAAHPRDWG